MQGILNRKESQWIRRFWTSKSGNWFHSSEMTFHNSVPYGHPAPLIHGSWCKIFHAHICLGPGAGFFMHTFVMATLSFKEVFETNIPKCMRSHNTCKIFLAVVHSMQKVSGWNNLFLFISDTFVLLMKIVYGHTWR
jgi:hypothetical protein